MAGGQPGRHAADPGIPSLAAESHPDEETGLGRFSERQIFNSLRYGLRPGETADVEITSTTPGVGNHPPNPKYLAPPMPWPEWRHMPDQDLWDIAAYLKHGVKPVRHRVQDSEGPPDFWLSTYTQERFGPYPATAVPDGPGAATGVMRPRRPGEAWRLNPARVLGMEDSLGT